MANMNVTYSEMKDAAGRIRMGKDDINAKLLELGTMVDGLVAGGFQTDQASKAYDQKFDEYTASTTKIIDALDGLAMFLDQAAETLERTDGELSSSIQS